ncbi:MAG: hypothetical protein K0U52_06345, partial [Gammaproteobacteria bacterium]|nr:hypothetical protein [Gammaproteobacteria bacterium]
MSKLPYFFTQDGLQRLSLLHVARIALTLELHWHAEWDALEPLTADQWSQTVGCNNTKHMPSDLEERKVHAFLVLQLADADSPWWTQLVKNIQYHSRQIQDRPLDHQHDLLNGFDYIRSQQTLDDAFTTAFEWVGTLGTWINNSGAPQYCMALLFLSAASSPDLQTQLLKHYCLVADVDSPCLFELPKVKDMSDVYLILTDNGFYKTH